MENNNKNNKEIKHSDSQVNGAIGAIIFTVVATILMYVLSKYI